METDPLARRHHDPRFARAYRSWLDIQVERATRSRSPRGRVVTLPTQAPARRATRTLVG